MTEIKYFHTDKDAYMRLIQPFSVYEIGLLTKLMLYSLNNGGYLPQREDIAFNIGLTDDEWAKVDGRISRIIYQDETGIFIEFFKSMHDATVDNMHRSLKRTEAATKSRLEKANVQENNVTSTSRQRDEHVTTTSRSPKDKDKDNISNNHISPTSIVDVCLIEEKKQNDILEIKKLICGIYEKNNHLPPHTGLVDQWIADGILSDFIISRIPEFSNKLKTGHFGLKYFETMLKSPQKQIEIQKKSSVTNHQSDELVKALALAERLKKEKNDADFRLKRWNEAREWLLEWGEKPDHIDFITPHFHIFSQYRQEKIAA